MASVMLTDEDRKEYIDRLVAARKKEPPKKRFSELFEGFNEWSESTVTGWVKKIYGVSAKDFFHQEGILMTDEQLQQWKDETFETLKMRYKDRKPAKNKDVLYEENADMDLKLLRQMMHREEEDKMQMIEADIEHYFYDAGIIERPTEAEEEETRIDIEKEKPKKHKKAPVEKAIPAATPEINIYRDFEHFDVEAWLTEQFGTKNVKAPKDKKYTVMMDDSMVTVRTYFSKKIAEWEEVYPYCYDAYTGVTNMLTREQVIDKCFTLDPNSRGGDPYAYATPEFMEDLPRLSSKEFERRHLFIIGVANLLANQDMMEEIARFAPRKKNGQFMKNRYGIIACSTVADSINNIVYIYSKAKDETTLNIYFGERTITENEEEKLGKDFLCSQAVKLGIDKYMGKRK